MTDPDDAVYKRNVRNMALVLTAIVLTVFAGIFIPPLLNPQREQFVKTVTVNSPQGFSLTIQLNETAVQAGKYALITAWFNNTSNQVLPIPASNSWPVEEGRLWTKICTNGWPLGVGVLSGYYTEDNYSSGTLVALPVPLVSCPTSNTLPVSYLLQPRGSVAVVRFIGSLAEWNLTTSLSFYPGTSGSPRTGVFTAIAADEWGDLVLTHFKVS